MNEPRSCPRCLVRPVMRNNVDYCHLCHPDGPVKPPPCRRCGTTDNYFSAGLCLWCHPGRPLMASSCPDCLAWGVYDQSRGTCLACRMFRKRHPDRKPCRICGHTAALMAGVCRLCRRQARLVQRDLHHNKLDLDGSNRHGQQLFFGDCDRRVRLSVPLAVREQQRRPKPAGPAFGWPLRPATHRQLLLFQPERDWKTVRPGRLPPPVDTELAAALTFFAREHAARLGWTRFITTRVCATLRCAVALQDTPGAAIKASELRLFTKPGLPVKHALAVLEGAGFLDDDRVRNTLETWFTEQTAELPEPMRDELRTWLTTFHHGRTTPPRFKPRRAQTVRNYSQPIIAMAQQWAPTHPSLREITSRTSSTPCRPKDRHAGRPSPPSAHSSAYSRPSSSSSRTPPRNWATCSSRASHSNSLLRSWSCVSSTRTQRGPRSVP
ncbi:hypothetical protein [Streptomyces natalensis]|uniref:hypothetical protein n=1 Tax=Streptomyces natalensis TaxID=68242 RepID=UPI000ABE26E1|nr:hypothetical protein [Streptomyces natalensis]